MKPTIINRGREDHLTVFVSSLRPVATAQTAPSTELSRFPRDSADQIPSMPIARDSSRASGMAK
ncbi:MAG TPA: hypothetical protein VFI27_08000, partial [candidate division Zixibacteria bacterium]|nr:hypothetical protein [candidate division Zixibacteria bacterium]